MRSLGVQRDWLRPSQGNGLWSVAALLVERIETGVVALARRDTGRPGRMAKLREKSVPRTHYIIAYRIRRNDLIVLRIIHSSQDWTSAKWPKSD